MTDEEFPAFYEEAESGYGRDIERHGGQTHEAAVRKAKADMESALPLGLDTPNHWIYAVEADGQNVGRLWLSELDRGGRRVLFIYEIAIDESSQGRGYGRAAMLLAEDEARTRGIGYVELNVFGGNEVARNLYRSLGYAEASVQMRKSL